MITYRYMNDFRIISYIPVDTPTVARLPVDSRSAWLYNISICLIFMKNITVIFVILLYFVCIMIMIALVEKKIPDLLHIYSGLLHIILDCSGFFRDWHDWKSAGIFFRNCSKFSWEEFFSIENENNFDKWIKIAYEFIFIEENFQSEKKNKKKRLGNIFSKKYYLKQYFLKLFIPIKTFF